MEKKIAIDFLKWVCKKCIRIQDNLVEYKGEIYVTYGDPFDNVRSADDLFEKYLKSN
jgi:hypothetical protein